MSPGIRWLALSASCCPRLLLTIATAALLRVDVRLFILCIAGPLSDILKRGSLYSGQPAPAGVAGPNQDPRVHTQPIQEAVVAGQDYRIATQPFPQGLLEGKGIELAAGSFSAVWDNDAVFRNLQLQQQQQQYRGGRGG